MEDYRRQSMIVIQESIKKELQQLSTFCNRELERTTFNLLKRKLAKPSVRSYYISWMYQYIQEVASKEGIKLNQFPKEVFTIRLPFVMETAMSIMYLDNQILDKKQGVIYQTSINDNLLGGNLLKDMLYDYVERSFPDSTTIRVNQYLRKTFRAVDTGQWLEKNYNTYSCYQRNQEMISLSSELDEFIQFANAQNIIDNIKAEIPAKANYIELYFSRIFLTCAALFVYFTQLILELLGYNGEHYDRLIDYARVHGTMRQIVNDNTDFVFSARGTTTKDSTDVLSDLKQGNITLPLIFHLSAQENNNLVRRYLFTRNPTDLDNDLILDEMIRSGALFKTMKIGRRFASSEGSRSYLFGNLNSETYLTSLNSIAFNNRFYHKIFTRRNEIKKSKKQNQKKIVQKNTPQYNFC